MVQLVRLSRPAMGSAFTLFLGGDAAFLETVGQDALDRVDLLEQTLSPYLPDSAISLLNESAFAAPVSVSPPLWNLLCKLRTLSAETENAFDCTAGKLVRLWGFFRRGQAQGEDVSPPDEQTLARIVSQIGWRNVVLNEAERSIRFLTPEVELHLGAAGKGYIVQCAADFLREAGMHCALVNSGDSSLAAIGHPHDREGWPVGLPEGGSQTSVLLCDNALSTSGSTEQFVTIAGKRVSHLFDPRTGQPVARSGSVCVISPDALTGDVLSTAFFVNGPTWAKGYCTTHPEITAIFIPEVSL